MRHTTFDQLLEEGVTTIGIHSQELTGLQTKAELIPGFLKHSVKEWERVQRATFFIHGTNIVQKALNARFWVPEAYGFAERLAELLEEKSERYSIPELRTDFNRVGFNFFQGSRKRPATIPLHTDPESLRGVVAVVGIAGEAESYPLALNDKMSIALIACQNLCEVREIEPVEHGVTTYGPRTSLTLAQFV